MQPFGNPNIPVTDGLVHQASSNSRVDTARNGTNNLTLLTADLPNTCNLLGDKRVLQVLVTATRC
jgi:hypothetical protein